MHDGSQVVGPHLGEFDHVQAGQNGVAKFELEDDNIKISGPNSVIAKSFIVGQNAANGVIVHSGPHPKLAYAGC